MIGEILRSIRLFHEVKVSELASEFSISQGYLSDIERGIKQPSIEILTLYSKKFDIPLYGILFLHENPSDPKALKKMKQFLSKKTVQLIDHLSHQ
jgi:transcriptional regulator with XRE-family HTH domain